MRGMSEKSWKYRSDFSSTENFSLSYERSFVVTSKGFVVKFLLDDPDLFWQVKTRTKKKKNKKNNDIYKLLA